MLPNLKKERLSIFKSILKKVIKFALEEIDLQNYSNIKDIENLYLIKKILNLMEIDLLKNIQRLKEICQKEKRKDTKVRDIAREFGKDFFDGDKKYGYGGHYYNEKYWFRVVEDIINFYKLDDNSKILDIGCAKGFMLYEFKKYCPTLLLQG